MGFCFVLVFVREVDTAWGLAVIETPVAADLVSRGVDGSGGHRESRAGSDAETQAPPAHADHLPRGQSAVHAVPKVSLTPHALRRALQPARECGAARHGGAGRGMNVRRERTGAERVYE